MMLEERLLAPAKLNLYLRIVGRRPDGYHLLDTLMVPIDLCDSLHLRVDPSARDTTILVNSDCDAVPRGPENLAGRAAAVFLGHLARTAAVDITIDKHIPVGSGLGGGSSDAGAVLLALNRLFGLPLGTSELATIGAGIGADVAFFVRGLPAHVRGIGDQIAALNLPAVPPLVVCWDRYSLSTRLVYSRLTLSLTSRPVASNITNFISSGKPNPEMLVNDLEEPAAQIHPEVLALKSRLMAEGASGASMTGSGAAVFGMWTDLQSARRAAMRLRSSGLWAQAVRVLAASPAVAR